jgi:type 1 glutamine amidotransferase
MCIANAEYLYDSRSCRMPVAWVKIWGKGRVLYSALGHVPTEFDTFPVSLELALRGMRWAADLL